MPSLTGTCRSCDGGSIREAFGWRWCSTRRSRRTSVDAPAEDIPPQAARLGPRLRALAARGVNFGTSSWKYDGWIGSIYREDRYLTRGKFSNAKFEEHCLTEYAETFPTVCGDLTFYQFPSEQYWAKLFDATPEGFVFGFKVPEDITVSTWPKHARYGNARDCQTRTS